MPSLLKDKDGRPIPQYLHEDVFEALLGRNGASRVELYGADGEPVAIEAALASIIAALSSTLDTQDTGLTEKVDALLGLVGEVDPSPTADTLLARLKDLLVELESHRHSASEPQNVTLTPSSATDIVFAEECAYFDILNEGPGEIWVKVDGTASIGGVGCLKLLADLGYSLRQRGTTVSIIGASASVVQVVGVR